MMSSSECETELKLFSHREASRMVADASQVLTESVPEAVDHIFRLTGKAITDGIDALYISLVTLVCTLVLGVVYLQVRQRERRQVYIPASVCE